MKTKNLYNKDKHNFTSSYSDIYSCDVKNFYSVLAKSPNNLKRCGIIFVKEFNSEKYLLVVRGAASGIWSLPKGRILENEQEEECASREVFEETGIYIAPEKIKIFPRIKIDHNVYFIVNLDTNKIIDINQEFNIIDKTEVSEVSWKTLSELFNIHCNKDIRNILKQSIIYY